MKRVAIALAAGLILLPGAVVVALHWSARRTIAGFEADTERRLAERARKGPSRPGVFGDVLPGEAMTEYRAAADTLEHRFLVFIELPEEPIDDLLRKLLPELPTLRRALRMRFDPPLEEDVSHQLWKACDLLSHLGRRLLREGRAYEALDLISVQAGLAQDAYRLTGTFVLVPHISFHAAPWQEGLESRTLKAPQLKELSLRLDALDRTRPSLAETLDDVFLAQRRRVFKAVNDAEFPPSWRTWRQLWSRPLAQAQALLRFEELVETWKRGPPRDAPEEPPIQEVVWVLAEMSGAALLAFDEPPQEALAFQTTRVALALARHQAELGRWPAVLEDLVPVYLERIPNIAGMTYAEGTLRRDFPRFTQEWKLRGE